MKLKLISLLIFCLYFINLFGQKKVNIDLNFSVYNSIGSSKLKGYRTQDGYISIQYHERKRFKNPLVSLAANLSYPVLQKLHIGLQSGIYKTFYEIYVSYPPTNHYAIPLQTTVKYDILTKKKYTFGLAGAAGINFFNINEVWKRYKNAALYNFAFYYKKGKSNFKLGTEKQIDNVTEYSSYNNDELFKHKVKRLTAFISYGFSLK